jgi:hypothetical protein
MNGRVKVLCITGSGRSGSTILDMILGHVDGFFSCGELRNLWDNGLKDGRLCGCGVALPECPVWKRVVEGAFGSLSEGDLARTIFLREQSQTLRSRLTMAVPGGSRRLRASPVREYLDRLEKLYHSIASTTGCRIIVDSSKLPSHTALLQMLPSVDVYVVHLLRDPRAVAYSWLRKKPRQDAGVTMHMPQFSPARTALQWNVRALSTAALCRRQRSQSLTLSYEDFTRDPREATGRIVALTGETAALPFVDASHARLGMTHTVWGNPGRFQSGTVEISMDDEWRRKMARKDRAVVAAMTWPLLAYYGYLGKEAVRPAQSA